MYQRESPTVGSFDDQYLTISFRLCLKMLLLVNFLAFSLLIKNLRKIKSKRDIIMEETVKQSLQGRQNNKTHVYLCENALGCSSTERVKSTTGIIFPRMF